MFKKFFLISIFFSLFPFELFCLNSSLKNNLFLSKEQSNFDDFFSKNSIIFKDKKTGLNCMHIATAFGNRQLINHLIQKKFSFDLQDYFGYTPIDWAYIANNKRLIKSFKKIGLNTNSKFEKLYEKINRQVELSNYAEILIDSILFFPDEDSLERSFFIADCLGLESVKEYLIKNYKINTNMHSQDESGMTFLHKAVLWQDYLLTKYFFKSGVDYKTEDSKGRTALDLAKTESNLAILDFLSESLASVEPLWKILF